MLQGRKHINKKITKYTQILETINNVLYLKLTQYILNFQWLMSLERFGRSGEKACQV